MASESTDASQEGEGERSGPSPDQTRRELEEEFNVQRAKMKELFLQKEDDIRKMLLEKEQLDSEVVSLRAELQQLQTLCENQKSEIQSLQLLVSETVEASSAGTEELRQLRARNVELEQQLTQLRQDVSLMPVTFVRSLARKLGADDIVDQPPRKIDDSDVLHSVIEPLEMEIAALKDKLRDTDTQLQEALKSKNASQSSGDAKSEIERKCDMCANYEKELVSEQRQSEKERDKATKLEQALRVATEELERVRGLHEETARAWAGSRQAAGLRLRELEEAVAGAAAACDERAAAAERAHQQALAAVTALTVDRETLQRKLDTLERDNAMLLGEFVKKAEEMQNEIIDLPNTVEELQECALRLREQVVVCAVGRERAAAGEDSARRLLAERAAAQLHMEHELRDLRQDLARHREELDKLQTEREQINELADKLRSSNDMIDKLLEDKKRLQSESAELRGRVAVLQQELDNSEKVQRDFVRLSQSLQVQLQRIREAETEVRWQHEEDVSECPACRASLPTPKKKVHCRHCGRIFCAMCVRHAVASGPRGAPARVCAVCRTLLQPDAAPYFSTEPPQAPL